MDGSKRVNIKIVWYLIKLEFDNYIDQTLINHWASAGHFFFYFINN